MDSSEMMAARNFHVPYIAASTANVRGKLLHQPLHLMDRGLRARQVRGGASHRAGHCVAEVSAKSLFDPLLLLLQLRQQ